MSLLQKRFWSKVRRGRVSDCWPWTGAVNSWGYGNFRDGAKMLRAHRVAYALSYGIIPDGALILHRCDNRRCCNPRHLRIGTQSENVNEEWARYRRPAKALGLLVTRTRRNGHAGTG